MRDHRATLDLDHMAVRLRRACLRAVTRLRSLRLVRLFLPVWMLVGAPALAADATMVVAACRPDPACRECAGEPPAPSAGSRMASLNAPRSQP